MQITLLCNAGLAITCGNDTLLIDAPNTATSPFSEIKDPLWQQILQHQPPYQHIRGLLFTHSHPDHYDASKTNAYLEQWPETPCFLPKTAARKGHFSLGEFTIEYQQIEHAPMDVPTPPHVVVLIQAGKKCIYIAGDAKLDCSAHQAFLAGRTVDAAFWNAMYLSKEETRNLMQATASHNYIYHMPEERPDAYGIWRKCEKNLQRFPEELQNITILDQYPTNIYI